MTANTDYSGKARAVFLAAIIVISMVGMPMALAGSAAAAAPSGGSLSDTNVQSDATVTIEGIEANSDGNELEIIAENQTSDKVGSTPISATDASTSESWSTDFTPADLGLDNGEFDIFINDTADGNAANVDGTLTVDDDSPTVTPTDPVDGDRVNSLTKTITLDISDVDEVTTNGSLQISANVDNNGDINTYEINPESNGTDGVSYEDTTGELTISPTGDDVPQLQEGDVDVSVSATDEAGNTGTADYSFVVDQNGPESSFDVPDAPYSINFDEPVTSDENETIEVSLTGETNEIDDGTVSLSINADSYTEQTFDYESDEYDNSTDTFTVTPDGDAISSFSEDEYTVTVEANDVAGNSLTDTHTFYVDQTGPTVTIDDPEEDVRVDQEAAYLNVTANDDATLGEEDVDASTIEAVVNIDGEEIETVSNFNYNSVTDEYVGTLDLSQYNNLENDSAEVNVTAASDEVGNEIENPAAAASETTFDIDTDGPSVELGDVPNDGVLSGYVNASALIASTNDVDSTTVEIWVGGEEASSESYTAAESRDIDTRELPDGEHTIGVIVEDDAGNQDVALADFTLNNGNDLTVQSEYLPGARHNAQQYVDTGYDVPVDGQFNLSTDVFNYSGFEGDVTYDKGTETDVSGEDLVFDANNYNDGEPVTLEASADGETARVDVVVNRVTTTTLDTIDTNGNSDQTNPSEIVFESNRANLDELNMTVQPTDGYTDNAATSLARDDFSVVEDDENPGTYIYTANVPDLRDGQFNVTVDDVADGTQTVEPDLTSDNFDIDYTEPGLESAAVVDGDADGLTVRATFNESVSAPALGTISVEDVSTDATDIQWVDNAESGVADITFDAEFQTEDQPNLTITQGAIDETFDVDNDVSDSNSADNNAGIYTSVQTLEEGLNPMSIPAESGEVAISDIEVDGDLEAIWAYTDGEWEVYNGDENDFTTLEGGQGYLANVNEETTISLNAENVPSADNQALTAQQINEGWNFVGHYQEGSQSVEQALTYLDGTGATYQIEQGYTGDQVNQLDAEEGYWLFSNAESYHAHVDYNGANSDQPVVGNVQMTDNDGELTDGEDVEISAEVQHDTIVETVEVSAISELGIGTVELTDANNDGVYNTTEAIAFDGANAGDTYPVFVTATDVDGNAGSAVADSVSVDETAPTVTNVTLENTSSELDISFNTDEQLDTDAGDITVNVDGPSTNNSVYSFNATQFSESDAGGNYTYELTASQGFDDGSGTYTASVEDAIDVVGNNGGNNGDVSGLTDDYKPTTEEQSSN